MNIWKRPNKLKAIFVMALALTFSVSWSVGILFAAAPTVTTGAASSVTKNTAVIDITVTDDGGSGLLSKGVEYGLTTSYGSSNTAAYFQNGNGEEIIFFTGIGSAEAEVGDFSYSFVADSSDNYFVLDSSNNRIQKFDSSGTFISMFGWGVDTGANFLETCTSGCQAGFPGNGNGQLNNPTDIAIDSSNNIYVFDSGNRRVQKFNSSGAYQFKFGGVGSTEGLFDAQSFSGIDVDSAGNIYVADIGNNRVQKFNSSGVFVSMFGWGVDTGANVFETCTSGCQAGIAGGGNGQFDFINTGGLAVGALTGVAIDSSDNIFVSDSNNNRIQKFNSSGTYQSQFGSLGTSAGEFTLLADIFIDDNDDIYAIDDVGNLSRLQKFDSGYSALGSFIVFSSGAHTSLIVNNAGKVEVQYATLPTLAITVRQYTGSSSLSGLVCQNTYHYRAFATNDDGTNYGSDATLTTLDCDLADIDTLDATNIKKTSAVLNGFQIQNASAIPITERGFEYGLTTSYGNSVVSDDPTGFGAGSVFEAFTLIADDVPISSPNATIYNPDGGHLYTLDTGNNRVRMHTSDFQNEFGGSFGWGVATNTPQFEVYTHDDDGGGFAGIAGNGNGQFNAPEAMALDTVNDEIYVADTGNNRIQVFNSSTGNWIRSFGSVGTGPGQFSSPKGVAVYSSGGSTFIYVSDTGNNRIQKLSSTGTFIEEIGGIGDAPGQFNAPEQLAAANNFIYVADTGNNRIQRFTLGLNYAPMTITAVDDLGDWISPSGIAVDEHNIYVVDTGNHRIVRIGMADDVTENFTLQVFGSFGSGGQQLDGPSQAFLYDGILVIADTNNDRAAMGAAFTSDEVTGLTCGRTYHYRSYISTADGTVYGDDTIFETKPCSTTSSGGGGPPGPDLGCTDNLAFNWDPFADVNDGSCQYALYGCTDIFASNFNSSATDDDGSCTYGPGPTIGCMDPLATNYNPLATVPSGLCQYGGGGPDDPPTDPVPGCTDSFADNFDSSATEDDGSCEYSLNSSSGCTDPVALNYNPNADTNDGSCTYEDGDPPPPPTDEPPIITTIVEVVEDVTGFDRDEQIAVYKDMSLLGLILPAVSAFLLQRLGIASIILRLWNLIPTLLGFRRRRRPWGTVYDSVTKQPLDPVYVTLFDERGREAGNSITDIDGRYGFITEEGVYKIEAKKGDYVFPSAKLAGVTKDELYDNLYFGEKITVEQDDSVINKNIPMDAVKFNWNEFEKAKNKNLMKFFSRTELFLARIAKIVFFAGLFASIMLVFLEPRTWNYIILAIYIIVLILAAFGIRPRQPGFIVERSTGYPLSFAIVTVFSALLNREIAHTIVSKTGKYHVLVPKGKYYLKLKKKTGENSYEEVYTSDVFHTKKGYINKIIKI